MTHRTAGPGNFDLGTPKAKLHKTTTAICGELRQALGARSAVCLADVPRRQVPSTHPPSCPSTRCAPSRAVRVEHPGRGEGPRANRNPEGSTSRGCLAHMAGRPSYKTRRRTMTLTSAPNAGGMMPSPTRAMLKGGTGASGSSSRSCSTERVVMRIRERHQQPISLRLGLTRARRVIFGRRMPMPPHAHS